MYYLKLGEEYESEEKFFLRIFYVASFGWLEPLLRILTFLLIHMVIVMLKDVVVRTFNLWLLLRNVITGEGKGSFQD